MISNYRPSSSGWAIILLSVTALALGGCGRKAGLDLPPTAAAPQAQATSDTEAERAPFIDAGLEPWVENVPVHFIRVSHTTVFGVRVRPA